MELKTHQAELQSKFITWAKENNVYYHPSLNLFATFEKGLRGVEVLTNVDKVGLILILISSVNF
jgi:hypothetical protein